MLIVGRECSRSTDVMKVLGAGRYYSWNRTFAIENTETGDVSEWVSDRMSTDRDKMWQQLASKASAIGVSVGADTLKAAFARSIERWDADHPIEPCDDCYDGPNKVPRGHHKPISHKREAPWAHMGGGTSDKRYAEEPEVAIIHPDGSYEVKADF